MADGKERFEDRCCFEGPYGRCGLRATINTFCTYHSDLYRSGSKEHSLVDFTEWMRAEIDKGSDRWLRHPASEWWDRIIGKVGPGHPWTWNREWDRRLNCPVAESGGAVQQTLEGI